MRTKLVAGNWKMNLTAKEAVAVVVEGGVEFPRYGVTDAAPTATITIDRGTLDDVMLGQAAFPALLQSGAIRIDGQDVTGLPANRRKIGMVFQEYSLFPWLNVVDNTGIGLEFGGMPKDKREQEARRYLAMVGLEKFALAMPHELSGGMRQRVAIARALTNNPDVLLMDEPFGAIDAFTRIILQKRLLDVWEKSRKTILFVTHSVDEAVYLADEIIVMGTNPGRIVDRFSVDMARPRQRDAPVYASLVTRILALLEQQDTAEDA